MTREIVLKGGQVALVDDQDFDRVSAYTWAAYPTGLRTYVRATAPNRNGKPALYLHRLIMEAPSGVPVDHVSADELDNRRANLRLCTRSENARNRRPSRANPVGFKGVWQRRQRFVARIKVGGRTIALGGFATAEEAARAYDRAALEHFGEFAWLNFPDGRRRSAAGGVAGPEERHFEDSHRSPLERDLFDEARS